MVWRRIELLSSSTFWDLHIAIQGAFGWLDYHLHEFHVGRLSIGIPDGEGEVGMIAGWTVHLSEHLVHGKTLNYLYDFGDDWEHTIYLEEIKEADEKPYPRCLAGENATPPEDCGGVLGFEEVKKVLSKPRSVKYRQLRDWLSGHAKDYWPFDPFKFDHTQVVFRDPSASLRQMLEQGSG